MVKIVLRIIQKLLMIFPKYVENLSKNWNINLQKWFPNYNLKNPKYIRNIEVWETLLYINIMATVSQSYNEGNKVENNSFLSL